MLKTEIDTLDMMERIEAAFASTDHADDGEEPLDFWVFFEHGQWWIELVDSGRTWSVVDCEGTRAVDGFDFELIEEGEEA